MPRVFYFDENMSDNSARSMHQIEHVLSGDTVTTIVDEFGVRGTTDDEIASRLESKNHNCIIITQDDDFAKREIFTLIMKSNNIGLFLIKFPKTYKLWEQHKFMVNHWEGIKNKTKRFPFAYLVKYKNKFSKI